MAKPFKIERRSNRRPIWSVAHECATREAALEFLAWSESTLKMPDRYGVAFRLREAF